jgi:hypothetical protein
MACSGQSFEIVSEGWRDAVIAGKVSVSRKKREAEGI